MKILMRADTHVSFSVPAEEPKPKCTNSQANDEPWRRGKIANVANLNCLDHSRFWRPYQYRWARWSSDFHRPTRPQPSCRCVIATKPPSTSPIKKWVVSGIFPAHLTPQNLQKFPLPLAREEKEKEKSIFVFIWFPSLIAVLYALRTWWWSRQLAILQSEFWSGDICSVIASSASGIFLNCTFFHPNDSQDVLDDS
jgi:hypothetical protein